MSELYKDYKLIFNSKIIAPRGLFRISIYLLKDVHYSAQMFCYVRVFYLQNSRVIKCGRNESYCLCAVTHGKKENCHVGIFSFFF